MTKSARPNSLRVALALSVLLHVALGVWLWHRAPLAATRPLASAPVEVEITETVRGAPPPVASGAAVKPPAAPAHPGRAGPRHSGTRAPASLAQGPQPGLATDPHGDVAVPGTPAPGSDRPSRPLAQLNALPSSALAMGPGITRGEPPSAQAVASGLMRQLAAQNRLERGAPRNGFFSELRLSLETLWQVEALLAQHRSLEPETDHARVRVVQASDGSLRQVELVTPPQHGELGRALLADLQAGGARLPKPPAEVLHGRSEVASLWDFTLKTPTSPIKLSFDFDLTSLVDRRAIPKPTRKKVDFVLAEE